MKQLMTIMCFLTLTLATSAAWAHENDGGDALEIAMQAALVDASKIQLSPSQALLLQQTHRALQDGLLDRALERWAFLVSSRYLGEDIESLLQLVLIQAYVESRDDLRSYVERVRFLNSLKKQLRRLLAELRDCRWVGCRDNEAARFERLEQELTSTEGDAQLANLDLQNALQKQQPLLQTLCNVSKLLHDTAMAVTERSPFIQGEDLAAACVAM
jgi:hypothetical protein